MSLKVQKKCLNYDISTSTFAKAASIFRGSFQKASQVPHDLYLLSAALLRQKCCHFWLKKSQQSNHKMGNFSCYKKLRRFCILANLMVQNHKNLFLSITLVSKINNCLDPRFTSGCVQILHLDLEAIMNDFSTSRIIVVLLFCWIYVFVARNGKIVLHRYEDLLIIADSVVLQYFVNI